MIHCSFVKVVLNLFFLGFLMFYSHSLHSCSSSISFFGGFNFLNNVSSLKNGFDCSEFCSIPLIE